jgi:hypothetical protein
MSKFKMKNGKGSANADSPGSFSSLDTSTVQSLNNMAFNTGNRLEKETGFGSKDPDPKEDSMFKAPSITVGRKVLRKDDFYTKPAADRVRTNLAANTTNDDGTPSPIETDEYGYSTNPNSAKQTAEDISLGFREASRRPITEQETKFESQFGLRKFDNLKPFLDNTPTNSFTRSRRRSEKPADTYKAYKEGPVAQRYQENVNLALQQLEREKGFTMKGRGSTVKSVSSQLQSSGNNAMSELQKKVGGLNAAQNIKPSKKPKKRKAAYSLASVAVQALKVPFTPVKGGRRQGAKNEVKRKAGLSTYGKTKMRLF